MLYRKMKKTGDDLIFCNSADISFQPKLSTEMGTGSYNNQGG